MPSKVHMGKSIANAVIDAMELMYSASDPRRMSWLHGGCRGDHKVADVRCLMRSAFRKPSAMHDLLRRLVWRWSVHEGRAVVFCVRRGAAVSSAAAIVANAAQVDLMKVLDAQLTTEDFDRLTVTVGLLARSRISLVEVSGLSAFHEVLRDPRLQREHPLVVTGFALSRVQQTAARRSGLRVISPSRKWRRVVRGPTEG